MKARIATAASVAAAVSLAISMVAKAQTHPEKPTYKYEKCYGIARAGHNDCYTSSHACGNVSKKDSDGESWMYTPAGTCLTIVGGSLSPKK